MPGSLQLQSSKQPPISQPTRPNEFQSEFLVKIGAAVNPLLHAQLLHVKHFHLSWFTWICFLHSSHILQAELQLAFLILLALRVAATPPDRRERVNPVALVRAEPMAAKSQTDWTQVEASHGTRSALSSLNNRLNRCHRFTEKVAECGGMGHTSLHVSCMHRWQLWICCPSCRNNENHPEFGKQEAKFRFQSRSWSSNHASGRTSYWDGFTPIASDWTAWKVMAKLLGQGAETGKCPHTCNVKHIEGHFPTCIMIWGKEIKQAKMCPFSIHGRLLVHSPRRCWPERSRWHSSRRLSQSNRQSNKCCRLLHFHLNAVPHCKCESEVMKHDET